MLHCLLIHPYTPSCLLCNLHKEISICNVLNPSMHNKDWTVNYRKKNWVLLWDPRPYPETSPSSSQKKKEHLCCCFNTNTMESNGSIKWMHDTCQSTWGKHVNQHWWCAWNPAVPILLGWPRPFQLIPLPLPSLSLVVRIMQQAADDYYESIEVHIRWPEGHDLVLSVSPKETVSTLKQKVSSALWPIQALNWHTHTHTLSLYPDSVINTTR